MKKTLALIMVAMMAVGCFAQLPSVTLKNIDGKTVDTAKLNNDGKPFIISFFATWCKPCQRELDAIHEQIVDWEEETGVKVIAVSIDQGQNVDKVKPLVDSKGWEYEVLLDPNGDFNRAMNVNGTSGGMVRLPLDYFDNLISYNTKTKLAWYTLGVWRAWQANQLSGWDENDFAFRLPPVPTGDYEIRIIYPPMANGGLQQYYIGTSNEPSSMRPLGIPIDARYPNSGIEGDRLSTGYLLSEEFTDYGVASDLVMRNHGYMRAPASFSRGTLNTVLGRITTAQDLMDAGISACCRYEEGYGTSMMRKIVSVEHLEQGETYWIRLKNLLRGYDQLGFSIDFIELVPVSVVNSQDLTEDWY